MRGKTVLPCRPRRDARTRRCPHGRDISCPTRHHETDPRLGQPMCPDCYDYQAAVLFNAYAADLWRRFVTYLPRRLARAGRGHPEDAARQVRIRFVKVAEYQARGVVHFHAVIRLDAPGEDYQPPPAWLHRRPAVRRHRPAAAAAAFAIEHQDQAVTLGFGAQTDPRIIRHGARPARHRPGSQRRGRGQLHRQVRHQDPDAPGLPYRRYALRPTSSPALLGPLPADDHHRLAARRHPHDDPVPGLGAHARLRRPLPDQIPPLLRHLRPAPPARTDHRRAQPPGGDRDAWGRPLDETVVLVLPVIWTYQGIGRPFAADAELALAAAARAREHDGQVHAAI